MFESLKNKFKEHNESNSPENMSFDFKLFFIYHIAMMVLFGARPIDDPLIQVIFASVIFTTLCIISIIHKFKYSWSWPGLTLTSIPAIIFNLVFLYAFFAFSSYAMAGNIDIPDIQNADFEALIKQSWTTMVKAFNHPVLTPWFLGGAGIVAFNILSSLKVVSLKKDEFEAQCNVS